MFISSDCRSYFEWRGDHLAYFHHGDMTTTRYLELYSDRLLIATLTTSPNTAFDFQISNGLISPKTEPKRCLKAQYNEKAPVYPGAKSQVAGKNVPPYKACATYGQLTGENVANGAYYQLCQGSPLLPIDKTKPIKAAECKTQHSPANFILWCDDPGYVLTDFTWPNPIPPYPNPKKLFNPSDTSKVKKCSASCGYAGSKYVIKPEGIASFHPVKLDPKTNLINWSCPEFTLLKGMFYSAPCRRTVILLTS